MLGRFLSTTRPLYTLSNVAQTSSKSSSSRRSFLPITESFALREGPSCQCPTSVTLYPYSWHRLAFRDVGPIAYSFGRTGSYGCLLDRIHLAYLSLPFVLLKGRRDRRRFPLFGLESIIHRKVCDWPCLQSDCRRYRRYWSVSSLSLPSCV